MSHDNFLDRRIATDTSRCDPDRRVSQQIDRLCGARLENEPHGAHRCYESSHEHPIVHRCACGHEWTAA